MKIQKCFLYTNSGVRSQWRHQVLSRYTHLRRYKSGSTLQYKPLDVLDNANIATFRQRYFITERPILLPRQSFRDLPAYERWFHHPQTGPNVAKLNTGYLAQHGAEAIVPLELTQPQTSDPTDSEQESNSFRQFHAPLDLFLQWITAAESQSAPQPQSTRLYLAQCQLLDLPQILRDDFPTPTIVAQAGKGDVYDTNVWIGYPPTYTPLHRDPNPNLFVQLAGRKVVRLLAPQDGQKVFSLVRGHLGRSGGRDAAVFRGDEMMQGRERVLLEQAVWDNTDTNTTTIEGTVCEGFEAEVEAGDGLFIPKGWWHSIKGTGEGVTASVSLIYLFGCSCVFANFLGQLVVSLAELFY
ncbi:hypothetical protein BJX99DRAFT_46201 [Aspergillus californicus]